MKENLIIDLLKSGNIRLEDIMSQCDVSEEYVKKVAKKLGIKVYPKSVLTKNRKGNWEVRSLVRRGTFVEYEYMNPQTLKAIKEKKRKLYLKDHEGTIEQWFIIPTRTSNKLLLIRQKDVEDKNRRVWVKDKDEPLW